MKRKILLAINGFLATILTALGFSSCSCVGVKRPGSIECMYGGPDMYEKYNPQESDSAKGDTLVVSEGGDNVVKPAVKVEKNVPQPVMYGGPYSRYNKEEKVIEKSK